MKDNLQLYTTCHRAGKNSPIKSTNSLLNLSIGMTLEEFLSEEQDSRLIGTLRHRHGSSGLYARSNILLLDHSAISISFQICSTSDSSKMPLIFSSSTTQIYSYKRHKLRLDTSPMEEEKQQLSISCHSENTMI